MNTTCKSCGRPDATVTDWRVSATEHSAPIMDGCEWCKARCWGREDCTTYRFDTLTRERDDARASAKEWQARAFESDPEKNAFSPEAHARIAEKSRAAERIRAVAIALWQQAGWRNQGAGNKADACIDIAYLINRLQGDPPEIHMEQARAEAAEVAKGRAVQSAESKSPSAVRSAKPRTFHSMSEARRYASLKGNCVGCGYPELYPNRTEPCDECKAKDTKKEET